MTIRRLDEYSTRALASSQVIIDLASAIKELLDNSLDSNATRITVSLGSFGLDWFEVQDDGHGIPPDDMMMVGQRGHTSKITHDDDIVAGRQRGFRGEALHSIQNISKEVSIISRTREAGVAGLGKRLVWRQEDRTPVRLESIPCNEGTTVRVMGLLNSLPVRLAEWRRNPKRYFNKAILLVQTMALACPQIKFRMMNDQQVLLSTTGSGNVVTALAEAFGGFDAKTKVDKIASTQSLYSFELYYSLGGRKTTDRQFIFVNNRPCEMQKLLKRLNDIGKAHGWDSCGIFIVYISSSDAIDYNVTPNKRQMMISFENNLTAGISEALNERLGSEKFLKAPTMLPLPQSSERNNQRNTEQDYGNSRKQDDGKDNKKNNQQNNEQSNEKNDESDVLHAPLSISIPETIAETTSSPRKGQKGHIVYSNPAQLLDLADCSISKDNFVLEKAAFAEMEIIGQFNKGFILTKLIRGTSLQVFIIDQHASDERYRLEQLQKSLTWSSQRLLQPISLSTLSLDDKLYIANNFEVLKANGFEVEDDSVMMRLSCCPWVVGISLDRTDFEEALSLMMNDEFTGLHCLRRVAQVLGYRACRSAIMIGDSLNRAQMTQVVRNLQGLDKPWICAHGRPTVRLLYTTQIPSPSSSSLSLLPPLLNENQVL